MARIFHPNPQPGTTRPQVGGVRFLDGEAEVDLRGKPVLRQYYERHGFRIDESMPRRPKSIVERLDAGAKVIRTPDSEGGIVLSIED